MIHAMMKDAQGMATMYDIEEGEMDERLQQIIRSHASARPTRENPAWAHTHDDLTYTLCEIERLTSELNNAYERAAQVCDNMPSNLPRCAELQMTDQAWQEAQEECAKAIRALKTK